MQLHQLRDCYRQGWIPDYTDAYNKFCIIRQFNFHSNKFEYEIINKWIENGITEETIKGALKEAILNNVRNFKYIDKIVYEWSKNGVKKKIKEEKSNNELFDYDWLEDNE